MVPVYKKEDRRDKANYRPITILIIIDKIFEQLLSKQVNDLFNRILDPFISAYRKKYSCKTVIVCLDERVGTNIAISLLLGSY